MFNEGTNTSAQTFEKLSHDENKRLLKDKISKIKNSNNRLDLKLKNECFDIGDLDIDNIHEINNLKLYLEDKIELTTECKLIIIDNNCEDCEEKNLTEDTNNNSNLTQLAYSLTTYAEALLEITNVKDKEGLIAAENMLSESIEKMAVSFSSFKKKQEKNSNIEDLGLIHKLIFFSGNTILDKRRYDTLTTTVDNTRENIKEIAFLLAKATLLFQENLYINSENESSLIDKVNNDIASLKPELGDDEYHNIVMDNLTDLELYKDLFRNSPALAFIQMSKAHENLANALSTSNGNNSEQLREVFDTVYTFASLSKSALKTILILDSRQSTEE